MFRLNAKFYMAKSFYSIAAYSILESLSTAFVGMINSAIIGQNDDFGLAAIGIASQPLNICLVLISAVTQTLFIFIVRNFGQKDKAAILSRLKKDVIVIVLITAIGSFFMFFFAQEIIAMFDAEFLVRERAVFYLKCLAIGTLFGNITMTLNTAQRAIGKTGVAFSTTSLLNIASVCFHILFISSGVKVGFEGAGYAIVLSNILAFCFALYKMLNKRSYFKLDKKEMSTTKTAVKVEENFVIFTFESIVLKLGLFLFNLTVISLGTTSYSAHLIGMSILTLSYCVGDGLGIATTSLVGKSVGENKLKDVNMYTWFCIFTGLAFSAVVSVIFISFPNQLYSIFTKVPAIIEEGEMVMAYCSITTILQIASVVSISVLKGVGNIRFVFFNSLVSVGIVLPLCAYVLCGIFNMGLEGVWIAIVFHQFVQLLFSSIKCWKNFKKNRFLLKEQIEI